MNLERDLAWFVSPLPHTNRGISETAIARQIFASSTPRCHWPRNHALPTAVEEANSLLSVINSIFLINGSPIRTSWIWDSEKAAGALMDPPSSWDALRKQVWFLSSLVWRRRKRWKMIWIFAFRFFIFFSFDGWESLCCWGLNWAKFLFYRLLNNENCQETVKWEFKGFDPNIYCEIRFAPWMICR